MSARKNSSNSADDRIVPEEHDSDEDWGFGDAYAEQPDEQATFNDLLGTPLSRDELEKYNRRYQDQTITAPIISSAPAGSKTTTTTTTSSQATRSKISSRIPSPSPKVQPRDYTSFGGGHNRDDYGREISSNNRRSTAFEGFPQQGYSDHSGFGDYGQYSSYGQQRQYHQNDRTRGFEDYGQYGGHDHDDYGQYQEPSNQNYGQPSTEFNNPSSDKEDDLLQQAILMSNIGYIESNDQYHDETINSDEQQWENDDVSPEELAAFSEKYQTDLTPPITNDEEDEDLLAIAMQESLNAQRSIDAATQHLERASILDANKHVSPSNRESVLKEKQAVGNAVLSAGEATRLVDDARVDYEQRIAAIAQPILKYEIDKLPKDDIYNVILQLPDGKTVSHAYYKDEPLLSLIQHAKYDTKSERVALVERVGAQLKNIMCDPQMSISECISFKRVRLMVKTP